MKLGFSQVYIKPGVSFPFSVHFQRLITRLVASSVEPSATFLERYGPEFTLVFNVSAKRKRVLEIRGPSVSRKHKFVEYTLFLPYATLAVEEDVLRAVVRVLLDGAMDVLAQLGVDTAELERQRESIVETVGSAPQMIET